jgi:hypothetical protein
MKHLLSFNQLIIIFEDELILEYYLLQFLPV